MSVVVQCLNCAQQFTAPDEYRGQRLPCPACNAPINIPPSAPAVPPVMKPVRGGALEMIEQESRSKPGGLETAKGFDKSTVAALGISDRKLYTGRSKSLPGESGANKIVRGGPLDPLLTHKLVLATAAASIGFFFILNHSVTAILLWSLGILIALGAWRSQELANSNRKVADDWKIIQHWIGMALLLLIFGGYTCWFGFQLYRVFTETLPKFGMIPELIRFLGWTTGAWVVVLGYCLLMWNRSSRFGFFKAAAWSYIVAFVLMLGAWQSGVTERWGNSRSTHSDAGNDAESVHPDAHLKP